MTNLLAWLIAFAIIDVVLPVPILALILIYVVLKRPRWFADLVREVYEGRSGATGEGGGQ